MGSVPPTGWYAEVDHPTRSTTVSPDLVGEPDYPVAVNQKPEVTLPVRRRDRWLDESWTGATVRVYHNGEELPVEEIADTTRRADGAELRCVGGGTQVGDGLRTRVSQEFDSAVTRPTLAQLVRDNSPYPVEERPVPVTEVLDLLVRSVDTQQDWSDWHNQRPSPDTIPIQPVDGGYELVDSCYRLEAEDFDTESSQGVVSDFGNEAREWSGYQTLFIGGQPNGAGSATYTITPEYSFSGVDVWARVRAPDGTHDGFRLSVDGQTTNLIPPDALADQGNPSWFFVDDLNVSLTKGDSVEVSIDIASTQLTSASNREDGTVILDQIAVEDPTYEHHIPDWGDEYLGNGILRGPATKPPTFGGYTGVLDSTLQFVDEAQVTVDAADPGTISEVGVNVGESFSTETSKTISDADSVSFNPGDAGKAATLSPVFTLARQPDGDGETPRDGGGTERIDSFELRATVNSTPLLLDRDLSGELADVLTTVCNEQDLQWTLESRPDEDRPVVVIGRAGTGQTRRPTDVTDWTVTRDPTEVVTAVRVRGGSATVQAEEITPTDDGSGTITADLEEDELVRNREIVRDPSGGGQDYTRGDDYLLDYEAGVLTLTSDSALSAGTTYEIDYDYQPSGEFVAEGTTASAGDYREVSIPKLSSPRPCAIAARLLVEMLDDPLIRAEVSTASLPVGWSVFDDLDVDVLPDVGPYDVQGAQGPTGNRRTILESRQRTGEEIAQFKRGLGTVEERV